MLIEEVLCGHNLPRLLICKPCHNVHAQMWHGIIFNFFEECYPLCSFFLNKALIEEIVHSSRGPSFLFVFQCSNRSLITFGEIIARYTPFPVKTQALCSRAMLGFLLWNNWNSLHHGIDEEGKRQLCLKFLVCFQGKPAAAPPMVIKTIRVFFTSKEYARVNTSEKDKIQGYWNCVYQRQRRSPWATAH